MSSYPHSSPPSWKYHHHRATPSNNVDQIGSLSDNINSLKISESTAINFEAYDDIPVDLSGEDIPSPAATFADIGMEEALMENINRCGYVKPTPVQKHAIPIAVAGRDLMACAQTGSGKTAAFCFPILNHVLKTERGSRVCNAGGGRTAFPLALILAPTRELASQIHEQGRKFAQKTEVKIVVAYGGSPIGQQLRNLSRGVDILVATPGRLVDMVERECVSLEAVKLLALDEADRMLDMGFEIQIRKIVRQMGMPPPGSRQTLLFSATFPSEIQRLASDFLSNYIFLSVGRVGSSTQLITQRVEFVADFDKRSHLARILRSYLRSGHTGKNGLTLVFVETKRGADALEHWLSVNGFPAVAIHGDKIQPEREWALKCFKNGSRPILVATDVASRGLDIPHVCHVINYDMPKDIDDYVHRIGRTGRAGNAGVATAFYTDQNRGLSKPLVELMQESGQEVPPWLIQHSEEHAYGGARSRRLTGGGGRFGGRDFRNGYQHGGGSTLIRGKSSREWEWN